MECDPGRSIILYVMGVRPASVTCCMHNVSTVSFMCTQASQANVSVVQQPNSKAAYKLILINLHWSVSLTPLFITESERSHEDEHTSKSKSFVNHFVSGTRQQQRHSYRSAIICDALRPALPDLNGVDLECFSLIPRLLLIIIESHSTCWFTRTSEIRHEYEAGPFRELSSANYRSRLAVSGRVPYWEAVVVLWPFPMQWHCFNLC